MFEIGNTLREARLRRGLNVAECEVGTKIRAKYLRAIEDEHFDVLPSPAYVRGFLTTYADYLGLDGRLFMDEYESRFGLDSEQGRRVERNIRARRRRGRRSAPRVSTEARLGWLGLGGLVALGVLMMQGMGGEPPATPFTPPAQVQDVPSSASLVSSDEAPEPLKVTLRGEGANGTFIEVHQTSESGPMLFAGILKGGGEQPFPTQHPLWLRTYNAAGLTVIVKGKKRTLTGGVATYRIDRRGVHLLGTGN